MLIPENRCLNKKLIMKKIIILTFFTLIFSCKNNQTLDYEKFSSELIGKIEYEKVHKNARDSINIWVNSNLGFYGGFKEYNRGYRLDPILCFDSEKNKLVGAILINHKVEENAAQDDIWFFYGAKIENKWYFFTGATIVLPREMYQKDVTKPLSFEKLHEIALKEVFSGYLKEKEKPFWVFWKPVEYEVNEAWFDYHFNPGSYYFNPTDTKREKLISESLRDSLLMLNVMDNWRDKSQRMHMNYAEMWEYYYKTKFPL